MVGVLTLTVPPNIPRCVRGHIEINNIPEHTVYADNGNEVKIPAERRETPVCDQLIK